MYTDPFFGDRRMEDGVGSFQSSGGSSRQRSSELTSLPTVIHNTLEEWAKTVVVGILPSREDDTTASVLAIICKLLSVHLSNLYQQWCVPEHFIAPLSVLSQWTRAELVLLIEFSGRRLSCSPTHLLLLIFPASSALIPPSGSTTTLGTCVHEVLPHHCTEIRWLTASGALGLFFPV